MTYNEYVKLCEEIKKCPQNSNSNWIVNAEALYTAKVLIQSRLSTKE